MCVYGVMRGEMKEKDTTERRKKIGRDEGTRDMSSERQTHRDVETRLRPKERETCQGARADRSSVLPFSRYLLSIFKAKLCVQQ